MALRTDYTDAVFTGNRKYRMINNADGTISLEDVTEYSQLDTALVGAVDMNNTNTAVNSNTTFREENFWSTIDTSLIFESLGEGVTNEGIYLTVCGNVAIIGGRLKATSYSNGMTLATMVSSLTPRRSVLQIPVYAYTPDGVLASKFQTSTNKILIYGGVNGKSVTSDFTMVFGLMNLYPNPN